MVLSTRHKVGSAPSNFSWTMKFSADYHNEFWFLVWFVVFKLVLFLPSHFQNHFSSGQSWNLKKGKLEFFGFLAQLRPTLFISVWSEMSLPYFDSWSYSLLLVDHGLILAGLCLMSLLWDKCSMHVLPKRFCSCCGFHRILEVSCWALNLEDNLFIIECPLYFGEGTWTDLKQYSSYWELESISLSLLSQLVMSLHFPCSSTKCVP